MITKPVFLWMIDLDDTLYLCVEDYNVADAENIALMLREFSGSDLTGEKVMEVLQHHCDRLDAFYGRSRSRFQGSWKETYNELCMRYGGEERKDVVDQLLHNTERPYRRETFEQKGLFPGAAETLDFLVEQGDRLMLVTREKHVPGELLTQKIKIDALGLNKPRSNGEPWFESIHIVDEKTREVFSGLLNGWLPDHSVSAGDSWYDVTYPLDLGMRAVFVTSEHPTRMEKRTVEPLMHRPQFHVVDAFAEIQGKYDLITRN
jgi:phosphoglycolate phosphatase-like HAD superfamily hydrolase